MVIKGQLPVSYILTLFFQKHGYRDKLILSLKEKFPDYGLTYAIGGQLSFDAFPHGWDKTYALKHVEDEGFEEIHFFGDKVHKVSSFYVKPIFSLTWNRAEMTTKYIEIPEPLDMP